MYGGREEDREKGKEEGRKGGRANCKAGGAKCKQKVNIGKGYMGVPCTICATFLRAWKCTRIKSYPLSYSLTKRQ